VGVGVGRGVGVGVGVGLGLPLGMQMTCPAKIMSGFSICGLASTICRTVTPNFLAMLKSESEAFTVYN